jgi:hypothetical protein
MEKSHRQWNNERGWTFMKKITPVALIFLLLLSAPVFGGMRCPQGDLISEGTYKIKVLMVCGNPVSKEIIGYRWEKSVDYKQKLIIEQWTYRTGPEEYTILTIVGGKVEKIEKVRR